MLWSRRFARSKNPICLGIDLSSSDLRFLELQRLDSGFSVHAFGRRSISAELMMGSEVLNQQGLADALRALLQEHGFWPTSRRIYDVAIAIPDACTIRKTLQVSERLNDDDLEELVHIELDKCMPHREGKPEEICYDFKRQQRLSEHQSLSELLIVATRTQHIMQRVNALNLLGLRVSVVDVESHAIQRALGQSLKSLRTLDLSMVLDLGAEFLKIMFFQSDLLIFIREEHFISQERVFTLDYAHALVMNIKRAYQYFCATFLHDTRIYQLILSGSGANLPGLVNFLAQHFECPIEIANPFVQMSLHDETLREALTQEAALYLIACGLAQRVC